MLNVTQPSTAIFFFSSKKNSWCKPVFQPSGSLTNIFKNKLFYFLSLIVLLFSTELEPETHANIHVFCYITGEAMRQEPKQPAACWKKNSWKNKARKTLKSRTRRTAWIGWMAAIGNRVMWHLRRVIFLRMTCTPDYSCGGAIYCDWNLGYY